MAGRGFCVKIRLDLHAITCPGVWLCPNGQVALRISTLDSSLESHRVPPIFPLLFHNKFNFKKIFTRVAALTELQQILERELLYAELIQWITPCNQGIILATFEINLVDLLYPVPCYKGLFAGVDVDLLMESTKYFPGIIVPKIEITTKTIIEEVLGVSEARFNGARIVNPKVINSKQAPCVQRKRPIKGIIRQRKVCHSQGKTKSQICRPVACKYQCELNDAENFFLKEGCPIDKCYHLTQKRPKCLGDSNVKGGKKIPSTCNDMHIFDSCPVCFKYKCYFSGECEEPNDEKNALNRYKENIARNVETSECTDRICCTCRPDSPISHEFQSLLRSKFPCTGNTKDKVRADGKFWYSPIVSECNPCYLYDGDKTKLDFYKNLERFYKRMYKQAKLRAEEAAG